MDDLLPGSLSLELMVEKVRAAMGHTDYSYRSNPPALDYAEKRRIYTFAAAECVAITEVTHFWMAPDGTHHLRAQDGCDHVVPPRWLHLVIERA